MSTPTSAPVVGGRSRAVADNRGEPAQPRPAQPEPAQPETVRTDAAGKDVSFDLAAAWKLNPHVALRPEPFGALLYHFGTRKLSFLKNLTVVGVVQSLATHERADDALIAAGIAPGERALYMKALAVLADSGMIVRR